VHCDSSTNSTNDSSISGNPNTSTSTRLLVFFLVAGLPLGSFCQQTGAAQTTETVTPHTPFVAPLPDPAPSSTERWDKLSVGDSNLHPSPPISGQTDTFPEFTRELLRVQWRDGDPIDLYIVLPSGVSKPPVILYLYGYPGEAVRFLDPNFCKTVTRNGFAAVSFSSMLTGQRYHDVSMKHWFVSDLERSLVGTTHDVQMTLNYLEERGGFDMTRIGIFGEGSGGTVALLAALVDRRIQAVDVLNPWGDWPSWLISSPVVPDPERPDYLTPSFLKSIEALDPVHVLPQLTKIPLRLQQTEWDPRSTPALSRDHIAATLPSTATLVQYPNARDYTERVGSNGRMLDWIESVLYDERHIDRAH